MVPSRFPSFLKTVWYIVIYYKRTETRVYRCASRAQLCSVTLTRIAPIFPERQAPCHSLVGLIQGTSSDRSWTHSYLEFLCPRSPLLRIGIIADLLVPAAGLVLVQALGLEVLAEEVAAEEIWDLAEAVGGVHVGGDAWVVSSVIAR